MKDARPTILIIEDEPEIRQFLRMSLGVEGYHVAESTTGRRGVIDAGTHKPDLAIIDLGLPDVDGIDVIRRIREWSSMPIVVLSARAHERSKIDALDAHVSQVYEWLPWVDHTLDQVPKDVVDRHLDAIGEAARGTENLMPVLKAALADYVTIGECCAVLRDVFGEYRPVEAP